MANEDAQVIARMRARADQCRRLASAMTDKQAAKVLMNMAEEVETDIARLNAGDQGADVSNPQPMPPSDH